MASDFTEGSGLDARISWKQQPRVGVCRPCVDEGACPRHRCLQFSFIPLDIQEYLTAEGIKPDSNDEGCGPNGDIKKGRENLRNYFFKYSKNFSQVRVNPIIQCVDEQLAIKFISQNIGLENTCDTYSQALIFRNELPKDEVPNQLIKVIVAKCPMFKNRDYWLKHNFMVDSKASVQFLLTLGYSLDQIVAGPFLHKHKSQKGSQCS